MFSELDSMTKDASKNVVVGVQDFVTIIEQNYFYIDKTNFIKEWWDNGHNTVLITRPRRFGKTLTMSMLEAFFSVEYKNRIDLFKGLSIWKDEEIKKLQGMFPVINISFASIKKGSFKDAKDAIYEKIRKLYSKYYFIETKLNPSDKIYFNKVAEGQFNDSEVCEALNNLCKFLYQYYGNKTIVLLDEYDTPMQEAYVNGYWEELVSFIRDLFSSTFKDNPYLQRGLLTGITKVSSESIFSDLNHLDIVSTMSTKFSTCFGFTEDEVNTALGKYGLSKYREKVKLWYNGFIFGNTDNIYNPWSIINFLSLKKFDSYWTNTSSNNLVSKLIREGNQDIKKSFEDILRGNEIECKINEHIVYNDLEDNEEAIWNLLISSGYLKVQPCDNDDNIHLVSVTNYETKKMFEALVKKWFSTVKDKYNYFISSLLDCDVENMNFYMTSIANRVFSTFDVGGGFRGDEPERFYHGVILGLLLELDDRYIITSNRESGIGRYDVMLEPRDSKDNAYILEFKVYRDSDGKDLTGTVNKALKQIEDKKYASNLLSRGISDDKIHVYGFAFRGKEVLIDGN